MLGFYVHGAGMLIARKGCIGLHREVHRTVSQDKRNECTERNGKNNMLRITCIFIISVLHYNSTLFVLTLQHSTYFLERYYNPVICVYNRTSYNKQRNYVVHRRIVMRKLTDYKLIVTIQSS